MINCNLNILGKRAAHSGKVHFVRMQPHRLHKELVADFFRKAHYLILDAWAIAGTYTLDFSGIEGRPAYVLTDYLVSFLICIAYPAGRLVYHGTLGFKAEGNYMLIAILNFQLIVINAVLCNPCGGSGLKAAKLYPKVFKAFGKGLCGLACVGTAFVFSVADIDYSFKICAGADHHIMHLIKCAEMSCYAKHAAVSVAAHLNDFRLLNIKVFLLLHGMLHQDMIECPVLLSTEAVYRRTFSEIEHTALYHHFIRSLAHFSAKSVDFPHKVTLCGAAD